jgi:predicted DNA-binding transcriptional regulator AlpA
MSAAAKNRKRRALAQRTKRRKRFHIDRRADALVTASRGSSDDELLSTQAVATWLGISTAWLEIARYRGYGPPYQRISTRCVRYLRGDVLQWLRERTHISTSEYAS